MKKFIVSVVSVLLAGTAFCAVTTHLSLDCREGAKVADTAHPLVYDATWYAGGVTAKITVDGQEIVSGTAGAYSWTPSADDVNLLTLNVYNDSDEVVGTESVYCLSREDLADLVIPEGTTEITEYAFAGGQFTSVTIPNSVTRVAPTAFAGCKNIVDVVLGGLNFRCGEPVRCDEPEGDWSDIGNGQYRSKVIGDNDSTQMSVHLNLKNSQSCSFKWKVSSESGYDKLEYSVDGAKVTDISGSRGWETEEVALGAGEHTIVWRYYKDVSSSSGEDCGWVDLSALLAGEEGWASLASIFPDSFEIIRSVSIGDGADAIASGMFANCGSLETIVIPSSVTSIGEGAFWGCPVSTVSLSGLNWVNEYHVSVSDEWSQYSDSSWHYRTPTPSGGPHTYSDSTKVQVWSRKPFSFAFEWEVSSLGSMSCYLDGKYQCGIGARTSREKIIEVPAGSHTIKWVYSFSQADVESTWGPCWQGHGDVWIAKMGYAESIGTYFRSGSIEHLVLSDVKAIPDGLFADCTALRSVDITSNASGVIFTGCANIESVDVSGDVVKLSETFPDSFTHIKSVRMGEDVTTIQTEHFAGCTALEEVTLPRGLRSIQKDAFADCIKLSRVNIPSLEDWLLIRFSSATANPLSRGACLSFEGDRFPILRLPDTVTRIEDYAFAGGGFGYVYIPQSVEYISPTAFVGCSNVVGVTCRPYSSGLSRIFPDSYDKIRSVTILRGGAALAPGFFAGCTSLDHADLPSALDWLSMDFCGGMEDPFDGGSILYVDGKKFQMTYDENGFCIVDGWVAGYVDQNAESLDVPEGVVGIGCNAFRDFTALKSVRLPPTLQHVGSWSFAGCTSLEKIDIPEGTRRIGAHAFDGCPFVTVSIPGSVESISEGPFSGCSNIVSAACRGNLAAMKTLFPQSYDKLRTVTISTGSTTLAGGLFSGCTALEEVTLPSGLKSVGANVFAGCDGLRRIDVGSYEEWMTLGFGNDVASMVRRGLEVSVNGRLAVPAYDAAGFLIAEGWILGCRDDPIGALVIPDGVVGIGQSAFSDRSSLTSVTVSDSVKFIGAAAFSGCRNLKSVVLPLQMESVDSTAFKGCSSLTELTVPAHQARLGNWFSPVCSQITTVRVLPGENEICAEMFRSCGKLVDVELPEGLTVIGDRVFEGCSALSRLDLPDSVARLGKYVFMSCGKLATVTLPSSVHELPEGAFSGCSSLKSLVVPASVTNICAAVNEMYFLGEAPQVGRSVTLPSRYTIYVVRGSRGWDGKPWRQCQVKEWRPPSEDRVVCALWPNDGAFSADIANVYDGFALDGSNLIAVVQVKTTKRSGKVNGPNITATATVTGLDGKKWSYSNGSVTIDGAVSGLVCTTKGCPVGKFGVKVGKNGMEGAWGEYAIFGARNGMDTKGDGMMAALAAYKGKWSVSLSTSGENAASPLVVRLQLDVQAKGVVKIAGNWESGEKVSASAQLVMDNGFAYVPVMIGQTKTTPAAAALLKIDPEAAAIKVMPLQIVKLARGHAGDLSGVSCPLSLTAGGNTTSALGEIKYLPSEVSKGGAAFLARVAVSELAYPAKFTQKGLPTGLKLDAATGVVSGSPTKPGEYEVTFTATSSMNSKSKDTVKATIKVDNYVDGLIPVEDHYGPYTPGVSYTVTIPEVAGCTVSGLPTGMKWTAKDVKAKDGTVTTPANSIYGIPTKPGKYTVYFKKSVRELNAKGKSVKVTHTATATFEVSGYPMIAILPSLAVAGSEPMSVAEGAALSFFVGVKQSFAIDLAGTLDGIDTTVSAKGLPSGLKLVKKTIYVDPTAKKKVVDHYEYVIEGVPTKASSLDKQKNVVPSHVTLTASNKYKWSGAFAFDITVVALPTWAYGTFNGGNTNGMATLTVSNVGKISGKWMSAGLTWTLSAASFDAYISSEQMYVATVIGKSGKLAMTNEIEVTEGGVAGFLTSGEDAASTMWEAWRNGWKEEPLKSLATKLKGRKVQVGEVLLTVGASGAVTAKGTFVTGFDEKKQKDITYSASCSTVLIPTETEDLYKVYLYFPPKTGKFDGFTDMVEIGFGND